MENSRVAELQLMHQLLKNVNKQTDMRKEWAAYLKNALSKLLTDEVAIAKI